MALAVNKTLGDIARNHAGHVGVIKPCEGGRIGQRCELASGGGGAPRDIQG